MTQKDAKTLQGLDRQAQAVAKVFANAGCELVAPDILQPADVFLDRSGENIRQRAYVFSDPNGAELCLRPDLTVPACRLYLSRHPQADITARYYYRGYAFRFQPVEQPGVRPREFEQMGVEFFGDDDAQKAEAEVLGLAVDALKAAGLRDFVLKLDDLGLFAALADGIDMPARWRDRMKQNFWRPPAFRDLLARLSGARAMQPDGDRAAVLDEFCAARQARAEDASVQDASAQDAGAEEAVAGMLDKRNIPIVGLRGLEEIAARLDEQACDRAQAPLSKAVVKAIEDYLGVRGRPRQCLEKLGKIAARLDVDISAAQDRFARRLDLAKAAGVDIENAVFSAEFGRNLEYYTGLVFQLEVPGLGVAGEIVSGGRYDSLMADIGAPRRVPAVGCAIHTERLLAIRRGAKS